MNAIRLPRDVDLTIRNWLNASLVSARSSIRTRPPSVFKNREASCRALALERSPRQFAAKATDQIVGPLQGRRRDVALCVRHGRIDDGLECLLLRGEPLAREHRRPLGHRLDLGENDRHRLGRIAKRNVADGAGIDRLVASPRPKSKSAGR